MLGKGKENKEKKPAPRDSQRIDAHKSAPDSELALQRINVELAEVRITKAQQELREAQSRLDDVDAQLSNPKLNVTDVNVLGGHCFRL